MKIWKEAIAIEVIKVELTMKQSLEMFQINGRWKNKKIELQGELWKIKAPKFNREVEEVVEAWMVNMNKYFQVYEYSIKLKNHSAIYQFPERTTLWWEEVKNLRRSDYQNVTWDEFQYYFKEKYLTGHFYDKNSR